MKQYRNKVFLVSVVIVFASMVGACTAARQPEIKNTSPVTTEQGDDTVATEPAPAPSPVSVQKATEPVPSPTQIANLPACVSSDCDCKDFATQVQAQQVLDAYSGDPFKLDRDEDGIACEKN
jgi:hypothetical protein